MDKHGVVVPVHGRTDENNRAGDIPNTGIRRDQNEGTGIDALCVLRRHVPNRFKHIYCDDCKHRFSYRR